MGRVGILHLVHSLNVGGAEKLAFDLSVALDKRRFRVAVACLDEAGSMAKRLRDHGIGAMVVKRPEGISPGVFHRLRKVIVRHRIDVVHAHQYTPFFYGVVASRLAGARCLFTEHGRHHPDVRKPKRIAVNQGLWRLCDATVAVSEFTRQALIDNEGFPASRVQVLYNGVDLRRFEGIPSPAETRKALGIPLGAPLVGTCARLNPEKNLAMLVEAVAVLRQKHPDAILAIAGDGPERAAIEQKRDALGLREQVLLLGFRDDVPALVSAFDVFCLTSLTEGTSVTLLEAMYAGKPAVVTRVGGNPEICLEGETGWLVPSGDAAAFGEALCGVFADPKRAHAMGAAARKRVEERFTFGGMVSAYEELYERIARKTA